MAMFSGPMFFALARILRSIPNSPPILTGPDTFYMDEDEGTAVIRLIAEDPDGDSFVFMLDQSYSSSAIVVISTTGVMEFTPSSNYIGTEVVHFLVRPISYK